MVAQLTASGRRQPVDAIKKLTDDASSCVRYIGEAGNSAAETDQPVWRIRRIVTLEDSVEEILLDNGNFSQIWDDRASLFPAPPACPATGAVATSGEGVEVYNTLSSVASATETTLISYTVPTGKILYPARIEISGENISTYKYKVDGTVVRLRRSTWTNFDAVLEFSGLSVDSEGLAAVEPIAAGSVVSVTVENETTTSTSDYHGYLAGTLVNA